MIRKDFLMCQISQLIQSLIDFLLKRKTVFEDEDAVQYIKTGLSLIKMDENLLFTSSADLIIDRFAEEDCGLEKIEMAAYLLLLDEEKRAIDHKLTVKKLLTYVKECSPNYSLGREKILKSISE